MNSITSRDERSWFWVEVPTMDYAEAWRLQVDLVAARHAGVLDREVFMLLEHPPVFTLGRRGGRENLMVAETLLQRAGIPIHQVERGGNITFHGPGQLVGYGIIDLQKTGWSVTEYLTSLEEVMIRTAAHWGVSAERNPVNRGIWVGNRKLGSIGIAVRHGITFHGFAFNVNLSLEPFSWINPCGLKDLEVTSLARQLTHALPIGEVREALRRELGSVFRVELAEIELATLKTMLREARAERSANEATTSESRTR